MKAKEAQYQQKFANILLEVEESDNKEVIFNPIDAPLIFSNQLNSAD